MAKGGGPSAELAALIQTEELKPDADKLELLRKSVARARSLEAEKEDLDQRATEVSQELHKLYRETLPGLLDEARVPEITIEGEGNLPRVKAEAKPFYNANIAAAWPPEQKAQGFAYLTELGYQDLIKTVVTVAFNREDRDKALQFKSRLERAGYAPTLTETVHPATLTAWLKEQVEKHSFVPDLQKIGGFIGRVVKLSYKDESNGKNSRKKRA